jgi:hypothetical protein
MICEQVEGLIGEGDAVIAWDAPTGAGFEFETFGKKSSGGSISMVSDWLHFAKRGRSDTAHFAS